MGTKHSISDTNLQVSDKIVKKLILNRNFLEYQQKGIFDLFIRKTI